MIGCGRAGTLLSAALAGRAGEAERLELEEHLAGCANCRADHAALASLRKLQEVEPPRLSDLSREKVRRQVLAAGKLAVATAAPARSNGVKIVAAIVGGMVLAAAGLVIIFRGDRVIAGDVAVNGIARGAIPRDAELTTEQGGAILVGGARVELAPGTKVAWHPEARTVVLDDGEVTVDVVPGQARRFRVDAHRFMVEVIGTRFTVDHDGVRTERGTVHVLSPTGGMLASVGAGQSWRVPPPPSPAPPPLPATPTLAPPPDEPLPVEAARARSARVDPAPPRNRLAEARRALAGGHGDRARAILRPILHDASDGAEAHSLIAESFLVESRYDDAVTAYRAVTRDYDGTPQAESALFAIAELESERARPSNATRALAAYLARYPNGRFAREAHRRLEHLAK